MQLLPARLPFLGSISSATPDAIVLGAPLDRTESFKSGTAAGPERIRAVSDVLETYSPALDRDLTDLGLADWGDVVFAESMTMSAALDAVAEAMAAARKVGLPILLGGEHTATVGGVKGVRELFPDLMVVHADAHTDLRNTYEGEELSHATVMRRVAGIVGLDRIAQLGIRSGTREEFSLARVCLQSGPELELTDRTRHRMDGHPVYLTIDVDVLDPSCAPGTGCPEPGGATFAQLLELVYSLRGFQVVAVDIMEVLPAVDVNDITSAAAAKLVRECALAFVPVRPPGEDHAAPNL